MKVVESIEDMKSLRGDLPRPVGFVPTMGYLHDGHLSLVKRSRADNASTVVSIFVNPAQFGQNEDLADYPRDIQRDLALLDGLGVSAVFIPEAQEMYPEAFTTWVEVERLTNRLEGASRPTHFRGVTTIVCKLFNIVSPDRAYFGQKDAQQSIVIRRMAVDLNMDVDVVVAPTVREPSGLAMSSRNTYLSADERGQAIVLSQSLRLAERLWSEGVTDAERVRREMADLISEQPLAEIDYVSIASTGTLEEMDTITSPALVSLAVRFGRTRLIDNLVLGQAAV
jgi:pantoate--beta-alanine ligase